MKTYIQFRRALRRYYANDPVEAKRMLGRSMSHYWRQQYGLWQDGVRNSIISDATCVAMALM